MKYYISACLLLTFIAVSYGLAMPIMVSAASTELFWIGMFYGVILAPCVIYKWTYVLIRSVYTLIKNKFKSENE